MKSTVHTRYHVDVDLLSLKAELEKWSVEYFFLENVWSYKIIG